MKRLKPLLSLILLLTLIRPTHAELQRIDRWIPIDQSCYGGEYLTAYLDHGRIVRMTFDFPLSNRYLTQEFIFQNAKLIRVNERIGIPNYDERTGFDYLHGSAIYRRYEITNGKLTSFHHIGDDYSIPAFTAARLLQDANLYKKIAHAPEKIDTP